MASDTEAADLDSLLKEYDESPGTSETPPANAEIGKLAKTLQPVVDYVNEDKAQKQKQQFDTDVKDMVGFFVKAEGLSGISDKLMMGFIEAHAAEDADFQTAFDNRAKNPKVWETAKETARDAITEMVSDLPTSKMRTDIAAAHATVDGSSDTAPSVETPSPTKKMNMSDREWREYKAEQEALAAA